MKIISQIPLWMLICLASLSPTTENALTTALPDICMSFHIAEHRAQIASGVYFLGFAVGVFTLGRVSDIYGRRPVVLGGLSLYVFASFLSVYTINIKMLIVLRFIQAFGASVGSVIGQAMSRDLYRGSDLSYVYASLGIALALVPSLSSAISGYIIEYGGWQYVYGALGIIFSIVLIVYIKYLPETNPYIGLANQNKYFTIFKVVIKDKIILLYCFIIGAFNGITYGFYIEAPFIFINKMQLHASEYGKLFFILSVTNAFGGFTNRFLLKRRVDTKKIMFWGLVISLAGCTLLVITHRLLIYDADKKFINIVFIFMPMVLHLIGHCLLIPLCLRHAMEDYGKVNGSAGSIFGGLYYILIAVISFIVSKIHNNVIFNYTLLFLLLSCSSNLAFALIKMLENKRRKHEFI